MCSCVQDVPMKWFLTQSSHLLQYGNILQYTRRQYAIMVMIHIVSPLMHTHTHIGTPTHKYTGTQTHAQGAYTHEHIQAHAHTYIPSRFVVRDLINVLATSSTVPCLGTSLLCLIFTYYAMLQCSCFALHLAS